MGKSTASPPNAKSESKQRQPEKKIGPFSNGIGVCIWLNTSETAEGKRSFRSITVNPRRYLDRESNEWKDAASFNPSDLPALLFCLGKAQEYCYETPVPNEPGTATSHGESSDEAPF